MTKPPSPQKIAAGLTTVLLALGAALTKLGVISLSPALIAVAATALAGIWTPGIVWYPPSR